MYKTYLQYLSGFTPTSIYQIYEVILNDSGNEISRKVIHETNNINKSNKKYFELLETRNHTLKNVNVNNYYPFLTPVKVVKQ